MPDENGALTEEEVGKRDCAIRTAALAGEPWRVQALAGLAALPAGIRGPGKTFTYLLTARRSPLREPYRHQEWSGVFQNAIKKKVLERTGRTVRTTLGASHAPARHHKPEYRRAGPGLPPLLKPEDVVPLLEKAAAQWPSVEAFDKLQIAIEQLKRCM